MDKYNSNNTDVAIICGTVFLLLVIGLIAIGDFTLHNSIISRMYASRLIDSHIKRQLIAIPFALLAALLAARFSIQIIKSNKYLAVFGVGAALIILFVQKSYSFWPNIRYIYFPVIGYIRPGYWLLLFTLPLLARLLAQLDAQRICWKVMAIFAASVCGLSFILGFLQDMPLLYLL